MLLYSTHSQKKTCRLYDRVAQERVEVSYREYGDMVHGFILFGGVLDTANAAVAECCEKLRGCWKLAGHAVA